MAGGFHYRRRQAFTKTRQDSKGKITVVVLFSGGCIDTIAAIRTGFLAIWGTEICTAQQRMWQDLTQSPSLGDTFQNFNNPNPKIRQAPTPDYMTGGAPCTYYCLSGNGEGEHGKTGWMFVAQIG
jgi:site-specific DNA-cytosine methylase